MIIYKKLYWGNVFSYGPKNELDLNGSSLTQLLGKNGHGKSSIALILEEVQFNTNSKKIKKADIINRYTKDKSYWIQLDFEKDGVPYTIKTVRTASSGTVSLFCNGEDISSHTATGTYKSIEYILGYDHKTFSQIVYQSSVSSLEFLTATDTARKKFLIDLLNLSVYSNAEKVFKEQSAQVSKQLDTLSGKLETINSWLAKYEHEDLTMVEMVEEPPPPSNEIALASKIQHELTNLASTNKRIANNNKYIEILAGIDISPWNKAIPNRDKYNYVKVDIATKEKALAEGKSLAAKCKGPTTKCPTCSQDVDNSRMFTMATKFADERPVLEDEIAQLKRYCSEVEKLEKEYQAHLSLVAEWEKYHTLIDHSVPKVPLDEKALTEEFKKLKRIVLETQELIDSAVAFNKKAAAKNSKIAVIQAQLEEMREDRKVVAKKQVEVTSELSDLQILVKAFSTTGLVAYKIENMVKDLEELTNEYLADMAGGRFQLSFQINSSDKLNVVITDNGRDIDIVALSSGERARVNISTLLAIRKLMQALSNSRTNLLILDETVENLDAEGKERLIEVLLQEDSLNTFIISHGFSHPLLEKISIIKENNVSRIE